MKKSIGDIIKEQMEMHPGFEVRDHYKLIYQISFGPAHLVKDEETVFNELEREISSLGEPLKNEIIIEFIDPDEMIIRINLRPYKAEGGSIDRLTLAFIESAKMIKEDVKKMEKLYAESLNLAEKGLIDLSPLEIKAFWNSMKTENYPPIEHSDKYIKLNKPSYRIIALPLLSIITLDFN